MPQPPQPPPQPQPPQPGLALTPQIIVIEVPRRRPSWSAFALVVLFVAVVAFAAYMSGKAAATPTKREAAEANLVAQAAVPLAMTAALW
jgi:glucose-6-phosphate isomerase